MAGLRAGFTTADLHEMAVGRLLWFISAGNGAAHRANRPRRATQADMDKFKYGS